MLYIVAIILPPLALLMVGAWVQAIINLILFVISIVLAILTFGTLWMICVGWALIVVYRHNDEQRLRRIAEETARRTGGR
jgi:uncharacterized membrane protein YqaE (UPF0057 family)